MFPAGLVKVAVFVRLSSIYREAADSKYFYNTVIGVTRHDDIITVHRNTVYTAFDFID